MEYKEPKYTQKIQLFPFKKYTRWNKIRTLKFGTKKCLY